MYIYEHSDWPSFLWDHAKITDLLAAVRHQQCRLLRRMAGLGFALREEATARMLTEDIVKTSEIEGEKLDSELLRSSVARRLGIDAAGSIRIDRHVEGVVEMMLDATGRYEAPLTAERLFSWHAALFPTGRSGMQRIPVGPWRTEGRVARCGWFQAPLNANRSITKRLPMIGSRKKWKDSLHGSTRLRKRTRLSSPRWRISGL